MSGRIGLVKYEHVKEHLPDLKDMKTGVIYVSNAFLITSHLCPCGCESETIIPINKEGWVLSIGDLGVTMTPSILQRYGCKSHYFIRNGRVVWA